MEGFKVPVCQYYVSIRIFSQVVCEITTFYIDVNIQMRLIQVGNPLLLLEFYIHTLLTRMVEEAICLLGEHLCSYGWLLIKPYIYTM